MRLYTAVLLALLATGTAAQPAPQVRGMDFDIYIRLNRGMTEGELLLLIRGEHVDDRSAERR